MAPASRLQELHDANASPRLVVEELEGNAARDKLHQRALRKLGWRSIVVWECQTEKPKTLGKLGRRLAKVLR